jgi:SsrA-binding protein
MVGKHPYFYGSIEKLWYAVIMNEYVLIKNRKAFFDFTPLEEFSAGAELFGFEVKSLRQKRGSLEGARVLVRGGEVFLVGASISPFQEANAPKNFDKERSRRLLLNKKEILLLQEAERKKGLTIIPISWYNIKRRIKLHFAIAKGKKNVDKREVIKERETKREMARIQKG